MSADEGEEGGAVQAHSVLEYVVRIGVLRFHSHPTSRTTSVALIELLANDLYSSSVSQLVEGEWKVERRQVLNAAQRSEGDGRSRELL